MTDKTVTQLSHALVAHDILDSTQVGLSAAIESMNDPGISARTMENLLLQRSCWLTVRKAEYIQADFDKHESNYGYYNVNDFMKRVCDNLQNYLSGIFNTEVRFEENLDIDINLCFDGRLMEMSIYDVAYNMLKSRSHNSRITFYIRNTEKYVKFGARSNYHVEETKKSLSEIMLLYPEFQGILEGESYASVAAKYMDGYVKYKYLKNMMRAEIFIPKALKISSSCMKEGKTDFINGETVMVYEVSSKGKLKDFFAGLGYEFVK